MYYLFNLCITYRYLFPVSQPRDQYISKLMKKVKQAADMDVGTASNTGAGEGEGIADSWEDLDDEVIY